MSKKTLYVLIPVAGLTVLAGVVLILAFLVRAWFATPIEVFGFSPTTPEQPIAFPHTKHVEQAGIDCVFCHRNVAIGKSATVPAVEQCMFCHRIIKGSDAPEEVAKLVKAWDDKMPINWERVHRLPDHVRFSHEPHLTYFTKVKGMDANQVCSTCHGNVGGMEVVKQVEALKMAYCVDCHRENNAPTDCVICHH